MPRSTYQSLRHSVRRQQRLMQMRRRLRGAHDAINNQETQTAPLSVYGLFSSASGLGEAARCLADGLETLGRTVHRIDVTPWLDPQAAQDAAKNAFDEDPGTGPILIHLNPVEAVEILVRLKPKNLAVRKRVGVWIYELSQAPQHWRDYVAFFDAVWTPSQSSASSLAAIGAKSWVVPYQHSLPDGFADQTHKSSVDQFNVLLFADARSSLARKNVHGAITAFQNAFADTHQAQLSLKLSNLPDSLTLPGRDDPNITLLTDIVSPEERLSMIKAADAMLSLHRAEGYGLSLVEAMLCGTALIMSREPTTQPLLVDECVWPVATEPVPVVDPQGIYQTGFWSDADLDIAARQLRAVFALWQSGALASGRAERQLAAHARFDSAARLEPMARALTHL